jgi:hypothetical protein
MKRYEFQLRISPQDYLDYYRGIVQSVVVRAVSGQRVQFPASLLRPFVTDAGIEGSFLLLCDENNKCIELRRVGR